MNAMKLILLCAAMAAALAGAQTSATDEGRPAVETDRRSTFSRTYRLPVLTVQRRTSGRYVGACSFLPLEISRSEGKAPLRISFSDDTPNGSGETIRNSLWTAALTAALQKESALQGVRITLDFKGGMDGPSAGAVMCLGIMSALDGRDFPDDFAMTGTILPDGTVGLVGGVPEKLRAAAKNPAIKRVAIPAFQRFARDSNGDWVDLFEFGRQLGLELRPVESIGDAYRFLHRERQVPDAVVSALNVCRESPAFETAAADAFKRRTRALRARIEGLSSNDLESVSSGWEWEYINPENAEQRFEEGAIFDALNLISRAAADLSAYLESWKTFREYNESFLDREDSNRKFFSKSLRNLPMHEWPVEKQLAFVDGFRADIRDLCARVLGWKTDDEGDGGDKDEEEDDEPWPGFFPAPGSSDLSAQMLSIVEGVRAEGQYRYMERQTFDRSRLEAALKDGKRDIYDEIEYDRKKLFFLMRERFRKPSFTDVPMPVLNAGPESRAAMEIFRAAWSVVDKSIETDVVDEIATWRSAHRDAVRQILIGKSVDYAVYDAAKRWGRICLLLLDESTTDGVEFEYPSWTMANFLFSCAELFAEASAQLLELDGESDNASFVAFITDRARSTALRSMDACRKAGIPCFGSVLLFQKAERNRAGGDASPTAVLADYWKATMTAKALIMAFKNGTGPAQGFKGYSESSEESGAKAAMSALIDCLLNAETKPLLDSLPAVWTEDAAAAVAVFASKSDDETWAAFQNLLKQSAVLLVLQAGTFAEMIFDEDNDPSDIPYSKDEVRAIFENWGRRLLGIAHAATRPAVSGGRLAEVLTAPKRRLKGREDAGRTLSLPDLSSNRRANGDVEVSVPSWENSTPMGDLLGSSDSDVFRPFAGKMVMSDMIESFADSSSWKSQATEVMDELMSDGSAPVVLVLKTFSDLLKEASRAGSAEELRGIFENFDYSALLGSDVSNDEESGAAFDED